MPKGQRKYKGTQKVEIIERMRREQMSFHEASRSYERWIAKVTSSLHD